MDAVDIVAALTGAARADLPPGFKLATVDPAYTVGGSYPTTVALPKVTFDGESTLSTKRYPVLNGYVPMPSQRVVMAPVGRTYVILGSATADAPILGRYVTARSDTGANVGLITPPGCRLHVTGTYSLTNAGGGAVLPWSSSYTTVDYESGGDWHDGAGANPERVTVPTGMDGFFDVFWSITWPAGDGSVRIASVHKNGTHLAQGEPYAQVNAIFNTRVSGFVPMVQAAAGDYFTVTYLHNASTSLNAVTDNGSTMISVVMRALAP